MSVELNDNLEVAMERLRVEVRKAPVNQRTLAVGMVASMGIEHLAEMYGVDYSADFCQVLIKDLGGEL